MLWPMWWTRIEFCQDVNLEALALDPDVLFAGIRDETPGREIHL